MVKSTRCDGRHGSMHDRRQTVRARKLFNFKSRHGLTSLHPAIQSTSIMLIRPATHADLPGILEIYNDAVLNTTATYDYEPRTLEHRTQWFEERQRDGYPIFVAVANDGKVLGWSALNPFHARFGYRFTSENSVYVAADVRGQGIGKQLLPPLIEGAKTRGLHAIIAAIDAQNESSIRLHARFGFEKVGHFKQTGFKFGQWLDVVYMERLI